MKDYFRARMARWIRKRQGPDTLPLTLSRRRLYILPTRAGLGFGILLLLMLIAGLNYANSTALFLTFLLTDPPTSRERVFCFSLLFPTPLP